MRRLVIIASVAVLALAKPEMYKETEDFQFSRSSSDDGTRSGYYGAKRGNMGGNYERAHNMDGLAQHQMSSAVRQVEGELGEGANMKTGSVYTSANSRGIYGSGNYDLSNLKGRNFAESEAFGNSMSHSSLTAQNTGYRGHSYSAAQNAGYSGFTKSARHSSGHQSADYLAQYGQNENAHIQDVQQAANQYSYGKQEQSGSEYKYYSHGGSQAQNQYDSSQSNLQHGYDTNVYGRRDMPVRVVVRPGSIVTVPIPVKAQDVSSYKDASYNANSINTEAEVLDNNDQKLYISPASKPKHYESSYSYRKEWEKHHIQPVTVLPTENPFPKNSELYDDSHLLQNAKSQYNDLDTSNIQSNSANVAHSNSYRAHTKSSSFNKSGFRAESQTQGVSAGALSNDYTLGTQNSQQTADVNNIVDNINTKPKSYQSSYSYHKSWERRGDPYVIKPVGPVGGDVTGQTSQRLVAASANQGAFSSHQYGSRYNQAQSVNSHDGVDCDCDENGYIRVARSADLPTHYDQEQQQFERYRDLDQQTQDFGQMTQGRWEDLGQQLQDFGQLTQNKWEDLGQQTQDLGQMTQNKWEDLGQQTQDLGQMTQNKWEDLSQQTQDLSQQTQNKWDKIETLGQETQNQWDSSQDVGQQSHSHWGNLHGFGQQAQNKYDKLESLDQQTQDQSDVGQEVNTNWDRLQKFDQHTLIGGMTQQQENNSEHTQLHEQTPNEDNISVFNQYTLGDQLNEQKQDTNFFNANNVFNMHQSTDEKDSFLNENDRNIDQQKQTDHEFSYNENLNNNGESHDNVDNPQQTENDDLLSFMIQHHYNNYEDKYKSDEWGKLNNGYQANEDKSKPEDPFSETQTFQEKWGQSQWQHSYSGFDKSESHLLTNIDSLTEKSNIDTTTTLGISTQKPTRSFRTSTTIKPKYHPTNSVISAGPMDIGRGDIGAEETLPESTEKDLDNTHILHIPRDRKPFKTPEEIESLSMTVPNQNAPKIQNNNNKENGEVNQFSVIGIDKDIEKFHHENTVSNSFQQEHTYTIDKLQGRNYDSNTNQKEYNVNKPSVHRVQPLSEAVNESPTLNVERHADKDTTYDFDVQQNTDQQFEDFSQSIQGSMDLGQQLQNSWQPHDDFVQHDVQQLEIFGEQHKNNFDINQHQDQNFEQQVQHLGRENMQDSQDLIDIEKEMTLVPKHQPESREIPSEPKNYIENEMQSSRNAPVLNNLEIKEKVEPQNPITQKDDSIVTPIEVTTEKPGFWASVGNKFSSAKETVSSWFKG